MSLALCPSRHVPHAMPLTLCPSCHVPHAMSLTPCPSRYVPHAMSLTPRPSRYVPHAVSLTMPVAILYSYVYPPLYMYILSSHLCTLSSYLASPTNLVCMPLVCMIDVSGRCLLRQASRSVPTILKIPIAFIIGVPLTIANIDNAG